MHAKAKTFIRAALVAIGITTAGVGVASAGQWRVDVSKCPDLREDRRDYARDRGWNDRREDRRDARVVKCPARAWTYVPDRGERVRYIPPRPKEVVVYRDGRNYYKNDRGALIALRLGLGL